MSKLAWLVALGAVTISGTATAQQQAGPAPGTSDSTKVVSSNREENAGYNKVIGAMDPVKAKPDTKVKTPGKAVPASAADIKPGSALRDSKGYAIGTIASVDADGAIVATPKTRIKVPLVAFGKDETGLLLGITAAKFDELVAKASSAN